MPSHVPLKIFNDSLFFVREVPDHLLKVFKFYFGSRFISMVMGPAFKTRSSTGGDSPRNPVSGMWEEKHLSSPPSVPSERKTHLYSDFGSIQFCESWGRNWVLWKSWGGRKTHKERADMMTFNLYIYIYIHILLPKKSDPPRKKCEWFDLVIGIFIFSLGDNFIFNT